MKDDSDADEDDNLETAEPRNDVDGPASTRPGAAGDGLPPSCKGCLRCPYRISYPQETPSVHVSLPAAMPNLQIGFNITLHPGAAPALCINKYSSPYINTDFTVKVNLDTHTCN